MPPTRVKHSAQGNGFKVVSRHQSTLASPAEAADTKVSARVSPRPSIGFSFDPRRWPKAPATCCAVLRACTTAAESCCAPQCRPSHPTSPSLLFLDCDQSLSNTIRQAIIDETLSARLQCLLGHAHRPLQAVLNARIWKNAIRRICDTLWAILPAQGRSRQCRQRRSIP